MASIHNEMRATETEIEAMEPIALCAEVEGEGDESFERCDINKAIEVDNKVGHGNHSLMITLKAKLQKVKRACEDLLLQYGVIEKTDTIRVYQVWPGKNVNTLCLLFDVSMWVTLVSLKLCTC